MSSLPRVTATFKLDDDFANIYSTSQLGVSGVLVVRVETTYVPWSGAGTFAVTLGDGGTGGASRQIGLFSASLNTLGWVNDIFVAPV